MFFEIQIDPITPLENQYREILEKGTEPYPTLADFAVKTPLELLTRYPCTPFHLTLSKLDRQLDVSPFLELQKPIENLPETEQKELIRYITEIAVDFIPQHVIGGRGRFEGNNRAPRLGALHNGTGFYQQDLAVSLIERLGLRFSGKDMNACPKCGDTNCNPRRNPICSRCHQVIAQCEKEYISHYTGKTTCNVCGEQHAACLEHIRKPGEKKCAVYPKKPADSQEFSEIVTIETRRLLQRLKRECRDILQEIRLPFPTLLDFHTRRPDVFLQQYPALVAVLTYLKTVEEKPGLRFPLGFGADEGSKKFISAVRDITAAEWGDTLADTSATAFLEQHKMKVSLSDIDTCPRCGNPACAGDGGGGGNGFCWSTKEGTHLVDGCGETSFPCDPRHNTFLTCDNPLCRAPIYRQCTEHTCRIDDHTGFVHYLIEVEQKGHLDANAQHFVDRINALSLEQRADFVKQFHAAVAQMRPIEKTAADVQKILRKHGLKAEF